jgi:hypothetical protein
VTVSEPVDHVALAARNNAIWCSIVCGTHGVEGTFTPEAWVCASRTPDGYPDAVTLRRGVAVDALLARIDRSTGCSIKDSFADLDLTSDERWRIVRDPEALREWELAWREGESGPRIFRPSLLHRDDVVILAIPVAGGSIATAILNRSPGVVGLSNVVIGAADPVDVLTVAVDAAARLFPGFDVVGYEQGSLLDAAISAGFEVIGDLRVWMVD